jgi:hypothetical protein
VLTLWKRFDSKAKGEITMRHFTSSWPRYFSKTILGFTFLLLLPAMSFAQKHAPAPPAPIPAQILAAKKVFIANAGWDEPYFTNTPISGGPNRAYDEFYAAMKSLGRYELVTVPVDADLLFEIRFNIFTSPSVRTGNSQTLFGTEPYDASFRLDIRDPRTNALLWAFVEHVDQAILQGNRDKDFDQALSRLVADAQAVSASQPSDASASAKP